MDYAVAAAAAIEMELVAVTICLVSFCCSCLVAVNNNDDNDDYNNVVLAALFGFLFVSRVCFIYVNIVRNILFFFFQLPFKSLSNYEIFSYFTKQLSLL